MRHPIRNSIFLALLSLLVLTGCERISNLYKEFQDKGYRFSDLFGEQISPKDYLGAYVYNEEMCFILKAEGEQLNVHFLENGLDETDRTKQCQIRSLGKSHWLFFQHKNKKEWIAIKLDLRSTNRLEVSLPRISLRSYVESPQFVEWLKDNPRRSVYKLDVKQGDSVRYTRRIPVYLGYQFTRISEDRAYAIRDSLKRRAMKKLFAEKNSIEDYEACSKRFPNDPLLSIIEKNIYNKCGTSKCYERFIARFPNSRYVKLALQNLTDLERDRIERNEFRRARASGKMQDIDRYISSYPQGRYVDSAYALIKNKANDIAYQFVDDKWASGSHEQAYRYAVYKLKYDPKVEADWCIRKLTYFSMQEKGAVHARETENLFAGLALSQVDDDARLCAQTYWAFLAWYRGDKDACIMRLDAKINEVYVKPKRTPFRKRLKEEYGTVKDWKVEFPNEKKTWKQIKKL